MSFGGVMVISLDPAIVDERLGLLMVIGAAFIGSAGTIVMKQIKDTGVYQMQAWIAMAWGGVVYTAIGASLIGHAGMYYLLQRYDVSVTSPLTLMAPVFGIIFGVVFWGDTLGIRFWIGGALTLFGVLIIGLRKPEARKAGAVL